MSKRIYSRIDERGDVEFTLTGFKGRDCEVETDRLRRELAAFGVQLDVANIRRTGSSLYATATPRCRDTVG